MHITTRNVSTILFIGWLINLMIPVPVQAQIIDLSDCQPGQSSSIVLSGDTLRVYTALPCASDLQVNQEYGPTWLNLQIESLPDIVEQDSHLDKTHFITPLATCHCYRSITLRLKRPKSARYLLVNQQTLEETDRMYRSRKP